VPADLALKAMNASHRVLLKLSFGKIGWKVGPMPVVELTTTGRKSGVPRAVMLTSPIQNGDEIVIVASRGGDDHHPAWYLNLVDDPNVEVSLGGKPKKPYTARVATPEERAEMWPTVESTYKGYAGYQKRTDRVIPLVVLSPVKQ